MNLLELFDGSLVARRDDAALEWKETTYTFGDIDRRSNRAANFLLARGVKKGDRVCVQLPNSPLMIDLFLACVKIGALFVPINVLYRSREMDHILTDSEPALILRSEDEVQARSFSDERPNASVAAEDPAGIIYTSGTTGASKGALLTHRNFAANALNLVHAWRITSRDRFLLSLPLFHVHGLGNGVCCWLASGCLMRLLPRFEHQTAAATFLDFRPTLFFGVPTLYVRLLELPEGVAREIASSMRLFVSGSAPLSAHLFEEFRARFGHAILERYGMSETLMTLSNPYDGERRAGTVGFPLPGVSVRIVDGELHVRGPNVFAGYWRRESPFVDGWFPTGDLASVSEDGYYTLNGRRSDLIISGGFNIDPREIEEFLLEQPEIAEAAVVGKADERRGEVPVAYVVVKGDFNPAELERRCRDALASFKVPREFIRIETLPRNALGKVQKKLLQ